MTVKYIIPKGQANKASWCKKKKSVQRENVPEYSISLYR
jgi:hypothetical protein